MTTRAHIVFVAMCLAFLFLFAGSVFSSRPYVGVDPAVASGFMPAEQHGSIAQSGRIPAAIGSAPTWNHQTGINRFQGEVTSNQAGLLIDYGNGTISWIWVPFADDEISVMAMLAQSDLDLVTVGFGGLGTGVCQIEYTGCGPTECRQRMCQTKSSDPFWRVMRLEDDTWRMTATGVDGTRVGDGGVVALSWSAQTPELPVVAITDIAANARVDPDSPPDHAVTRTIGDLPDAPDPTRSWVPIAGSVGVVLVVAGGLTIRAKRHHRIVE